MPPRVSLHLLRALPEGEAPPPASVFARALGRAGMISGEVNLILTGADEVRRLNREFGKEDRDTDVLAFDYGSAGSSSETKRQPSSPRKTSLASVAGSADEARWQPTSPRKAGLASVAGSADEARRQPTSPRKAGLARKSGDASEAEGCIWGDVYVSAEAARRQALERGIAPREELARLFLHGCLHLLGYRDGDPRERARMEMVQESLVRKVLGLSSNPGRRISPRKPV